MGKGTENADDARDGAKQGAAAVGGVVANGLGAVLDASAAGVALNGGVVPLDWCVFVSVVGVAVVASLAVSFEVSFGLERDLIGFAGRLAIGPRDSLAETASATEIGLLAGSTAAALWG